MFNFNEEGDTDFFASLSPSSSTPQPPAEADNHPSEPAPESVVDEQAESTPACVPESGNAALDEDVPLDPLPQAAVLAQQGEEQKKGEEQKEHKEEEEEEAQSVPSDPVPQETQEESNVESDPVSEEQGPSSVVPEETSEPSQDTKGDATAQKTPSPEPLFFQNSSDDDDFLAAIRQPQQPPQQFVPQQPNPVPPVPTIPAAVPAAAPAAAPLTTPRVFVPGNAAPQTPVSALFSNPVVPPAPAPVPARTTPAAGIAPPRLFVPAPVAVPPPVAVPSASQAFLSASQPPVPSPARSSGSGNGHARSSSMFVPTPVSNFVPRVPTMTPPPAMPSLVPSAAPVPAAPAAAPAPLPVAAPPQQSPRPSASTLFASVPVGPVASTPRASAARSRPPPVPSAAAGVSLFVPGARAPSGPSQPAAPSGSAPFDIFLTYPAASDPRCPRPPQPWPLSRPSLPLSLPLLLSLCPSPAAARHCHHLSRSLLSPSRRRRSSLPRSTRRPRARAPWQMPSRPQQPQLRWHVISNSNSTHHLCHPARLS